MVCKDFAEFEERREGCIVEHVFPAILIIMISASILLYVMIYVIVRFDPHIIVDFLVRERKIKELWAIYFLSLMFLESIVSVGFLLTFPLISLLNKIYLNKIHDRGDSLLPFALGLLIGPFISLHLVSYGDFLLPLLIALISLLLSMITFPILHTLGKMGKFFSGIHPVTLIFLIIQAEALGVVVSYILMALYIIVILSLLYYDFRLSRFWINFGNTYIRFKGFMTKDELEHFFSMKLDRPSAIFLANLLERIGLKVKTQFAGNEVLLFEVRA